MKENPTLKEIYAAGYRNVGKDRSIADGKIKESSTFKEVAAIVREDLKTVMSKQKEVKQKASERIFTKIMDYENPSKLAARKIETKDGFIFAMDDKAKKVYDKFVSLEAKIEALTFVIDNMSEAQKKSNEYLLFFGTRTGFERKLDQLIKEHLPTKQEWEEEAEFLKCQKCGKDGGARKLSGSCIHCGFNPLD